MLVGTILAQYWTMSRSSVGVKTPMDRLGIGSIIKPIPTSVASSRLRTHRQSRLLRRSRQFVLFSMMELSVLGRLVQGQLGNGGSNSDLDVHHHQPSTWRSSGRTAKAITGGKYHFCAILDDDSVKCWATVQWKVPGTGSISDKNTPTSTSGSFLRVGMRWPLMPDTSIRA